MQRSSFFLADYVCVDVFAWILREFICVHIYKNVRVRVRKHARSFMIYSERFVCVSSLALIYAAQAKIDHRRAARYARWCAYAA